MKRFDPITQARIDLTAALRSAARMGLNEGVCNHFSLEMPGDPTKFLINPQGFHWSELTPADLMVVDEKGERLALGIARYDAATLRKSLGKKQQPIFIHYDQLHRAGEW